ncbi:MAG: hypothetical protein WCV00_22250 [Verrucomicrobiia bacterium]|jgi:tetratricopeptide (TPR) repeat protein
MPPTNLDHQSSQRATIVKRLRAKASQCIEQFEYKRALKVGRKIERLRHTSGFEIMAQAYWAMDQRKKAIVILKKGVKKVPDLWLLWDQLGCYCSDQGQYGQAMKAFKRAGGCPGADISTVRFNMALVYVRQRRPEAALETIRSIRMLGSGVLAINLASLKVQILTKIKRFRAALRLANRTLWRAKRLRLSAAINSIISPHETGAEVLSRLYVDRATAYWCGTNNRKRCWVDLMRAIELNRTNAGAMSLMREVEHQVSPAAKYMRVLIQGLWHRPLVGERRRPGFFTTFDVVADDPDEALKLICRFEPPRVRPTLRIEECRVLARRPTYPKGVYDVLGYAFFTKE